MSGKILPGDREPARWLSVVRAAQDHHRVMWRQLEEAQRELGPHTYVADWQALACTVDILQMMADTATDARAYAFRDAIICGDMTQADIARATKLSPSRVGQIVRAK